MQNPVIIIHLGVGDQRVLSSDLVAQLVEVAHQLDMALPHLVEVALDTWLRASGAQWYV